MTIIVYGIKNCESVKKARAWLDGRAVAYRFHDYKLAGIDRTQLERWCDEVGWESLINRTGTTFRRLSESEKQHLDRDRAIALMLAYTSLIKRPILQHAGRLLIGFEKGRYEAALAKDA